MLDQCISAVTPLMSEGVAYAPVAPDPMDDIRHNAEVRVSAVIVIETCMQFSSVRCGDVLSEVFVTPGDIQTKIDPFYCPLARNLCSLLQHYELKISDNRSSYSTLGCILAPSIMAVNAYERVNHKSRENFGFRAIVYNRRASMELPHNQNASTRPGAIAQKHFFHGRALVKMLNLWKRVSMLP